VISIRAAARCSCGEAGEADVAKSAWTVGLG
jgi:hypothetical protein